MPVYEYHCDACGKDFEATQRMSDPPLTSCSCGAEGKVKRLMSAGSGLIFKGSGFYITDYKNGNSSPATNGGSNGSGESSSKSESTSKTESSSSPAPSCGSGGCPSCSD